MRQQREIEPCETRLLLDRHAAEEPRQNAEGECSTATVSHTTSDSRDSGSTNATSSSSVINGLQVPQSEEKAERTRSSSSSGATSSSQSLMTQSLSESRQTTSRPGQPSSGGRFPAVSGHQSAREPLSIMDTIGREIAVIVAPVSVCMLIVVCLVLTLTPNGSPDGSIMPAVGSLVYQEKSTDSDMQKLEGGLLNALAFVGMVAVLTFVLVGLFWMRCTKCLWGYMGFSGFTILACLGGYVAIQVIKVFSIPLDVFSFLFLLYNVSVVGVLAVFFTRMPIFLTQCYLVLIAAVVAFWFTHLPEWTTWLILIAMAVYDIVAVLAPGGPLKLLLEIAMEREEDLPALVYEARPPPHAPLTPPPEPSTSPPTVLVAGDRAGPFLSLSLSNPGVITDTPLSSLFLPSPPRLLARTASDSVLELAPITTVTRVTRVTENLPQPVGACVHAAAGAAVAAVGVDGVGPTPTPPQLDNLPPPIAHGPPSSAPTEPRRLMGRFERRAPGGASTSQSNCGTPSRVARGEGGLVSVVSEGSALPHRERERESVSGPSAERRMQSRRERAGEASTGPGFSSASLPQRSSSFPQNRTWEDSPGSRRPQLYLQRLEVPVDGEGTAVVVPRQRSPVRRHVSRKPGGSEVRQGTQDIPMPQQTFHLFSDLRPQGSLPPGPVRVLSTEIDDTRNEGFQEHRDDSVPEFVLPAAIKLGLGDFIFYSIMVGRAAMYDLMTVYACYLAIVAGLGATLVLLAVTRRALPALPFSICLGVVFYLLTRVLLEPFVIVVFTSLVYF